jgi:hypothetical protein
VTKSWRRQSEAEACRIVGERDQGVQEVRSKTAELLAAFEQRGKLERRAVKRRLDSPFQDMFEPTIAAPKGRSKRKVSPDELLQLRLYKRAREGEIGPARTMLRAIKENEKARVADSYFARPKPPTKKKVAVPKAGEALLLLGIAEFRSDGYWPAPWTAEAALEQLPADVAEQYRHLIQAGAKTSQSKDLTAAALQHFADASSPQANRFKKGQSGNPRGRPYVRGTHLPYPFLEEKVATKNQGKVVKISRAKLLIHSLYALAAKDEKISLLLCKEFEDVKLMHSKNTLSCYPTRTNTWIKRRYHYVGTGLFHQREVAAVSAGPRRSRTVFADLQQPSAG